MRYRLKQAGRARRGFTLIELVVVLVVVGIMLLMAQLTLNRGGRDDLVDSAAEQLVNSARQLAHEAVMSARPIGLDLDAAGFAVTVLRNGSWMPLADDDLWRRRTLDAGLVLRDRQGRAFRYGGDPDLIFLPSGAWRLQTVVVADARSHADAMLHPRDDAQLFTTIIGSPP